MSIFEDIPLYKKSDIKWLCERLIPITSLKSMHYGSNFCPFHLNRNTPAASLFKDKDGVERLYCYSCKKQYTSYDYITEILMEKPLDKLLELHTKQELDKYLENKVDIFEIKTSNIIYSNMESFLTDLYNYHKCKEVESE